jgi:hypothetical protein
LPAQAQERHDERQQGDHGWQDRQRNEDAQANESNDHRDNRWNDHRDNRQQYRQNYNRHQRRAAWQDYNRYDYNQPDPRYGSYQAERYYRDGRYYQPQRLGENDRIYRGGNGRYYCRRSDGTTGLIIGALGGGLLGNAIAPRGSKTLGAILGGGLGAVAGQSIDRNGVTCR